MQHYESCESEQKLVKSTLTEKQSAKTHYKAL